MSTVAGTESLSERIDRLEKDLLHLQGIFIDMQQANARRDTTTFQAQQDINMLLERVGVPK